MKNQLIFPTPDRVPINNVPGNMEVEVIDVQCTSGVK